MLFSVPLLVEHCWDIAVWDLELLRSSACGALVERAPEKPFGNHYHNPPNSYNQMPHNLLQIGRHMPQLLRPRAFSLYCPSSRKPLLRSTTTITAKRITKETIPNMVFLFRQVFSSNPQNRFAIGFVT